MAQALTYLLLYMSIMLKGFEDRTKSAVVSNDSNIYLLSKSCLLNLENTILLTVS